MGGLSAEGQWHPAGIPAWPRVRPILEALKKAGYQGVLVGGAVRDLITGTLPADVDLLTDAGPDEIRSLFSGQDVRHVGKSFGVSLVNGVEVASCRSADQGESASGPGREVPGKFPEDDLGLRDVTINSMALDPFSGLLIDPYGGRQDLSDRIIRFTRDPIARILEDPLRMVRACRFAARYGAGIDPGSFKAIVSHKHLLADRAAPERLQTELIKAMAMAHPSQFFIHLHDTGLLAGIFPCLDRCHGLDGGPHHGESVFDHCMIVGDALPAGQPLLRLAGFIHDAGKYDAAVPKEGGMTFAGHETCDEAIARDLSALRFSRQDQTYILALVRAHMRPLTQDSTPRAVRRLLAMLDSLDLDYRDFLRLRIADKKGNLAKQPYTLSQIRVRLGKLLAEMTSESAFNINALALSGGEICKLLNIAPGPEVGRVKQHLFDQVLADPSLNSPEALADLVRNYHP